MNFLLHALVVLLIGVPTGCSSGRPENNHRLGPTAVASIRNGITTKADVRGLLGTPQSITRQVPILQPAGAEPLPAKMTASVIWDYWTDVSQESPSSISTPARRPRYMVTIFFDARGVVLDCQTEASDS